MGLAAEARIGIHILDDDLLPALPNLIAEGGLDIQLAFRSQAKADIVTYRAGDPACFSHPRNGGEAHAGGAADDIQQNR